MILQNMKNLLHCLPGLERLELVDLQLNGEDGERAEMSVRVESSNSNLYHRRTCPGRG